MIVAVALWLTAVAAVTFSVGASLRRHGRRIRQVERDNHRMRRAVQHLDYTTKQGTPHEPETCHASR